MNIVDLVGWGTAGRTGARPARRPRLGRARDWPGRHPLVVRALALTLVWEIVTELVGVAASLMIPPHTKDVAAFIHPTGAFAHQRIFRFEAVWVRWDGVFYATLGTRGYGPHPTNLNAFFPAYPLLVHVLGLALGGRYVLAAVLFNRLLLFPAVVLFAQLVRRPGGDGRETRLATPLVLMMPGAVFFLGALTELLFTFAVLACLLALRRERYMWAGSACALATATRLPGLVLLAAMAVELLVRRRPWRTYGTLLIGVLGIAAYSAYTAVTEHDAFAFRSAYANGGWNNQQNTLNVLLGPSRYLRFAVLDPPYRDYGGVVTAGYLAALALVVVSIAACWRQLPWSHRVFAVGTAVLPLLSGSMFSYYRYSLVPLLPVMIVACRWLAVRPTRRDAVLLCLAGLTFFNVIAFAGSYWVG